MEVLGTTGVIPKTESRKPRQDVEAFLVLCRKAVKILAYVDFF